MKKILLFATLISTLFLAFGRVSEAQTKPAQIQSELDKNKPKIVAVKTGEPAELAYDAGTARFLVNSEDTRGAWSLVELKEMPGYKTNLHRHNTTDEAFYVLEGVLTLHLNGKTTDYPAGSYVLVPRGTPHAQGNFGKVPVKLLLTITPSGFEQSFKDRVELFKTVKPDNPNYRKMREELTKKSKVDVERLGIWDGPAKGEHGMLDHMGTTCKPVSERAGDVGCWVMAVTPLGKLSRSSVFWHLDNYPSKDAAEAAKGPNGTVVEALGKIWLFTIADAGWRPSGGVRVAKIGPLLIKQDEQYSARYMESIFTPGMTSPVHRHPGPEAWYTTAGEICLETPEGKSYGRAGESTVVPAGPPMHLTATGAEQRRSLALILYESSQPPSIPVTEWKPKGLCKK